MVVHHYNSGDTSGSESDDDTARNTDGNTAGVSPSSWRGWKERGKQAYLRGDYASALQAYSQALQRQHNALLGTGSSNNNSNSNNNSSNRNNDFSLFPSRLDQQILLSNMVACRLKLGGAPQAEAAVANAKKCIALNDQWAKGHLRLAEAYLALGRSYGDETDDRSPRRLEVSNKACDALQRVVDLDPTNQSARNMLTKELRYWAVRSGDGGGAPEPSAPPEHMDNVRTSSSSNTSSQEYQGTSTDEPQDQDYSSSNSNNNSNNSNYNNNNGTDDIDIEDDGNYDFTPSWQDRLSFQVQRVRAWYSGLSEDDRMLVHLAILFVVLYVAFGGRFGLEYYGKNNAPQSRSNNVYDEFYASRGDNSYGSYRRTEDASHSYRSYDRYGGSSTNYHSGYRSRNRGSSSSGWWDTGLTWPYVMVVLVASYIGQRVFGISPYTVLFFLNVLGRRRGGGRYWAPRQRYGGGWGYNRHRPFRGGMWGR